MPKRTDLKSILIIGAGPIIIGQACEFDYSGVQACKALREEGYKVILINSNPATIMTDPATADVTYIEPITWQTVEKIIAKERPDAILPTMGGQTALNCALDLWRHGVLEKYKVELIGATPEGKKELVGFQTGVRESAQSWRELLIDIKERGLEIAPDLAVGDGALGFWKAIEQVFPSTRHQRCWVHKTANVLNKVALSVQANMKTDLREIYGAPTRAAAEAAIDVFADKYGAKYEKAVACLTKDREALLAFFDFPAEHWDHLRTSNPIESVFATVRHRTVRTKGALSAKTAKLMVFKLVDAAAKTWRRLKGENQLPKVIAGIKFQNGIEVIKMPAHHAA